MKVSKVESNFGNYAYAHEKQQGSSGNGFSQTLAMMRQNIEKEDAPAEPIFQMGGGSFSQGEWEQLLDSYEEIQENLLEQLRFLQQRFE